MIKSEFWLQLIVFGMTASIISLLAIRIFPSNLFSPHQALADELISPVPVSYNIKEQIHLPEAISIPAIELNLPIAKATILGNEWTLYTDKVSWLSTSSVAGIGNTILYAHNRPHLFGDLKKLKIGDEIIVTQNNQQLHYLVSDTHKVAPTEVDAVVSTNNQLVLYTCDGAFDQRRLIVIALPKDPAT